MATILRITFLFVMLKFDRSLTDIVYVLPAKAKVEKSGSLCGHFQLLPPCAMPFYPGLMRVYLIQNFCC